MSRILLQRLSSDPPADTALLLLTGGCRHSKLRSMNALNLKIVALAVLLLTFLSVSGATFAGAASPSPGAADSCCFSTGNGEELPHAPGATSDCLCLFCLNLHLTRSADISFPSPSSACPVFHSPSYPLAAFVRPIDYPPESS